MSTEPPYAGYEVRGRHGSLGIVVAREPPKSAIASDDSELVVMGGGGRSSLLRLHIPLSQIAFVSHAEQAIEIDLDVVDFTAYMGDDGLVDLRL